MLTHSVADKDKVIKNNDLGSRLNTIQQELQKAQSDLDGTTQAYQHLLQTSSVTTEQNTRFQQDIAKRTCAS